MYAVKGGGLGMEGGGRDHKGGTRDGTGVMIMSLEAHTRRGVSKL